MKVLDKQKVNIFANRKLLAGASFPKVQQKPRVHTVATPGRMSSSISDPKKKEKAMTVVTDSVVWFMHSNLFCKLYFSEGWKR